MLVYVVPVLILVLARVFASIPTLVGPSNPRTPVPSKNAPPQPMSMGSNINTAHREAEPTFTADGRTMYFNCNNADICVSHLVGTWEQGQWTVPELLDAPINTEYLEVEPVINASGDKLYFMSIRPQGALSGFPFLSPLVDVLEVINRFANGKFNQTFLGGFGLPDVYVSYQIDGAWTEPVNLKNATGEPHINTPFADH